MDDEDDAYFGPRARSRPQQVRPSRGITSFPTDADPDYSTTGASDEEVDFSETTRTTVLDPTGLSPGALTIDTGRRKLYLSLGDGRALEYGIGVGRQGFAWKGGGSGRSQGLLAGMDSTTRDAGPPSRPSLAYGRWFGKPTWRSCAVPVSGKQGHALPHTRYE
jgi:lipoprotein-anchoring transpeptidase ErfK/SrfK